MSYTKTNWVDGVTPVNAQNMNNIENGIVANEQGIQNALSNVEANPTTPSTSTLEKLKIGNITYQVSADDDTPSYIEMPVEDGKVTLTVGGVYVFYGTSFISSGYTSSIQTSGLVVIPPFNEMTSSSQRITTVWSSGSNAINAVFKRSDNKLYLSNQGTSTGIVRCLQLVAFE